MILWLTSQERKAKRGRKKRRKGWRTTGPTSNVEPLWRIVYWKRIKESAVDSPLSHTTQTLFPSQSHFVIVLRTANTCTLLQIQEDDELTDQPGVWGHRALPSRARCTFQLWFDRYLKVTIFSAPQWVPLLLTWQHLFSQLLWRSLDNDIVFEHSKPSKQPKTS